MPQDTNDKRPTSTATADNPAEPDDVARCERNLNELIVAHRAREAFERFHADDVVMQENDDAGTRGKDANRRREDRFYANVRAMEASWLGGAVTGDVGYSEWHYVIDFKTGDRWDYHQIAARRWQHGKVVHERFYHADFPIRPAVTGPA